MAITNSQICLYKQDGCQSVEIIPNIETKTTICIKTYRRRFWMLSLFSTLSMLTSIIYTQYTIMANVNICFYGVGAEAVNWTSLLYLAVYMILVFPVSWLMNRKGLRIIVILGSIASTIAFAVEFATLSPNSFVFVMITSFFASLSSVFVLAVPPCLAAIWFPSKEVSRACAIGVFGNQLGVAVGFVIAPLLISNDCSNKGLIAEGKRNFALILTIVNVIVLLLILLTFQNKPKLPPSTAQAEKKDIDEPYLRIALSMARNVHFVLVFIMYGLIVGTYFAMGTLLNYLILFYFPNANVAVGWMGVLLIVTGLTGSIVAGYVLDYSHRFKETSISICFLSFLSYVIFSCLLPIGEEWVQYITISILGFFLTSFLPVGFEYGIEVTYPESEIVSSGLLNSSTMLFGLILIEVGNAILQKYGPTYINIFLALMLLTASAISCFITKDYKRSKKDTVVTCSTNM